MGGAAEYSLEHPSAGKGLRLRHSASVQGYPIMYFSVGTWPKLTENCGHIPKEP